ncbi:MAG: glycosyltransferase [Thermocladium sp.]|jgi:glycosyltransferase involved in cell wall biosynthesis
MDVAVFTVASTLSGGHLRILNALSRYPKRPTLFIPRNYYDVLLHTLEKFYEGQFVDFIKNNTIVLPPRPLTNPIAALLYMRYLRAAFKRDFHYYDIFYVPHEHTDLAMMFKGINHPWTALLQLTPAIGSLAYEGDRSPMELIANNYRIQSGIRLPQFMLSEKLIELKLAEAVFKGTTILSVSRSIRYELKRLGINIRVKPLDPGVGVDDCPLSLNKKDIDAVFFGRLIPGKGIFEFLHVIKKLKAMGLNPMAVMAGHPEKESYVRELRVKASNMGIEVDIRPGVERSELMNLVSRSKVFIYPTKLDSVGMVVLEALNCGVPVVTHDIPATRFNFKTKAVIRVPLRDVDSMASAAAYLIKNDDERIRLGLIGKRFTAKYDWSAVAITEWEALRSIANNWSIIKEKEYNGLGVPSN